MSRFSICESRIQYPEISDLFLIEEETHCGFEIVAIANTRTEANAIYDRLTNKEIEHA